MVPTQLIVDGQQRLASVFAVLTGWTVVRQDNSGGRIRIAFRPADAGFAVTDAAIEKDPEFIADISGLWHGGTGRHPGVPGQVAGPPGPAGRSTTPRRSGWKRRSTGRSACSTTRSRWSNPQRT
jgi:hypothetical protein